MTDLIARLRKDRDDGRSDEDAFLKWEAADEIERLLIRKAVALHDAERPQTQCKEDSDAS